MRFFWKDKFTKIPFRIDFLENYPIFAAYHAKEDSVFSFDFVYARAFLARGKANFIGKSR